MSAQASPVRRDGLLVLAGLLIVAGIVGLAARWLDVDVASWLGGSGWALFVIVPGLVLLASGLFLSRPVAGLVVAGSIVTAVGLLLLYQDLNAHYESWAYAWTLIGPGAAGAGLLLYGLRASDPEPRAVGARMVGVAAVLFVIGFWFFETIFRTGRVPFDLGELWPVALVAIGLVVLVLGVIRPGAGDEGSPT